MSEIVQLPRGWIKASLQDVAVWSSGGTPSRKVPDYYKGNIPWLKTGELGDKVVCDAEEHITEEAIRNSSAKIFPKGSVVLAMYGATIGKASILGIDAATNQACAVGNPDAVTPDYLYYYLISQTQKFIDAGKGGAQPNISQQIVRAWPINVAPQNEQIRIVDKLEELFSELDAGVKELKAAQTKLSQYRQSLLKSAVEGSLTEQWRVENRAKVQETGEQLLARILKQRREQWQQQKLAEFAKKGKTPPKGWQDKYPEPVQPDTTDLPELPEVWGWASVAQVASDLPYSLAIGPFGSNLKVSDYRDEGVPLIFVRNIRSGNYGGEFTKFISEEKAIELAAHKAVGGDVIITKMGEPPGDADIYPLNQPDSIVTADCIKVSCDEKLVLPAFLKATINSLIGRQQIRPMTKGVAQKKVSLGRFSFFAVPIPSLFEQKLIITKLSEDLELITRQLDSIHLGLKQSEAQRKNILKSAFSGQLVPQDPNDEPASVLLERIKQEREALVKMPKPRKPSKPKKS